MNDLFIIDDFVDNIDELRQEALGATFRDWEGGDGGVYQRVSPAKPHEVVEGVNKHFYQFNKECHHLKGGWRLNYAGEMPNNAIHSDDRWAGWAIVLYLDPTPPKGNGTAFWRHIESGCDKAPDNEEEQQKLMLDWDSPEKWAQIGLVEAKYNRAAIYRGEFFHSRHPFTGYGSCPEDGRLIYTGFFNARRIKNA